MDSPTGNRPIKPRKTLDTVLRRRADAKVGNPLKPRVLGKTPRTSSAHITGPTGRWDGNMREDGGVVMSAGATSTSSSVSPLNGPQQDSTATAVMSARKRYKSMLRRPKPVGV